MDRPTSIDPIRIKLRIVEYFNRIKRSYISSTRVDLRKNDETTLPYFLLKPSYSNVQKLRSSSSARKSAIIEEVNRRGWMGSLGSAPSNLRQALTPMVRAPARESILLLPGEVTVQQMTSHFLSLHSMALGWVTRRGDLT